MGGFLNMDNILTGDEAASLFLDDVEEVKEKTEDPTEEKEKDGEHKKETDATEVDPDELFEEEPESVGSEGEASKQEDAESQEDGSSPNNNFYSSIASALKEEGVFPDLEDDVIELIVEPEDFKNLITQQIYAGLLGAQKRIHEALNNGVQPNVVLLFENTLNYLNSITEEQINDESELGEEIRKRLLYGDFLNRGYSQERAEKMTTKLIESGDDVEEAKQALMACKEYWSQLYSKVLNDAKKAAELEKALERNKIEQLKKSILETDTAFGSIPLDRNTKQKILDNSMRLSYKDPNTGQPITAIQKYRLENENDYIRNVGILFTLTDGFKNIDRLIQPSAKKEVKKKLKELEHTLKNTNRGNTGNVRYVGQPLPAKGTLLDNDFTIDMS